MLIIGIPLIIIIIAAIIVIPMLFGSGGNVRTNAITFFYDRDQIMISVNNNPKIAIDGEISSVQRSIDGSKAAFITDYKYEKGGSLWFVSSSGYYLISDDVLAFVLADSGNGVAFATDYNEKNDTATLFLYDTSSKKSTRLTEEAYTGVGGSGGVCISPNGRSVSYVSDFNDEKMEYNGYICIDGKAPERFGQNVFAVALSDGGRHLYYVKVSKDGVHSLHVRSGRNENRLVSELYGLDLILNIDYSQAIFDIEDRSYISVNGAERARIGGSSTIRSLVVPRGTQAGGNHNNVIVYGIRNFANNVVRNQDGLAYMNSAYEISKISSTSDNPSTAAISTDGRTLYFINNNGHLSVIDPTNPNAERREVGRDVKTFVSSNDGKTVYYVTDEDVLFYVQGNGMPARVSDEVYAYSLRMSYSNNMAFFLTDYSSRRDCGELQFSNNGGRKTRVAGGDEVTSVWVTAVNVFFETTDNAIFRSNGNERFAMFVEDASRYN